MAIWQSIVKITLTSILSGLVIAIIAVLLNLRVTGKSLYEILLGRRKIVYFSLVLLILLIPIVFSLPRGTLLSHKVLAVYVRELLVSVFIVVLFSVTWRVLNAPDLWTYVQMNRAQIASLAKILEGDITGRYELREDIQFGEGLRLIPRLVARVVLWWSSKYRKELRLILSYQQV